MTKETVFSRRIRELDHIDLALTDSRLCIGWRIRLVDNDEMLDVLITLISDALDRAQDTGIAGCGRDNRDKGIDAHSKGLRTLNISRLGRISYWPNSATQLENAISRELLNSLSMSPCYCRVTIICSGESPFRWRLYMATYAASRCRV